MEISWEKKGKRTKIKIVRDLNEGQILTGKTRKLD